MLWVKCGGCGLMARRMWWGCTFANVRLGAGLGPKPRVCNSVSGVPYETAVGSSDGRWWVRVNGVEMERGLQVRQREAGGGFGPKPETSVCSSVSCVPCKTAVAGDAGRRWVWVKGTEVTGGLCIRQCQAVGWGLGQKPETKPSWLGYGRAVQNGGRWWYWEVVGMD